MTTRDHHLDHHLLGDHHLDKSNPQLDLYRSGYGATSAEFHHGNRRMVGQASGSFLDSPGDAGGYGHCGSTKTFGPTSAGLLGMQSCPVFGHMVPVSSTQDQGMFSSGGVTDSAAGSCAYNPAHSLGHFLQPK